MATSEGDLTNPNLDDLPERVQQGSIGFRVLRVHVPKQYILCPQRNPNRDFFL